MGERSFRRRRALRVHRRLIVLPLLVVAGILAGCASPPTFTGNNTNIHMQGGTSTADYYVYGGWFNSCAQHVYNGSGQVIGVYIDDSVAMSDSNWVPEATCVWQEHQAGYGLIIAAVRPEDLGWSFAPWGATWSPIEWYPLCGNRDVWGPPERWNSFIMQWNFAWTSTNGGQWNGMGNCGTTTSSALSQEENDFLNANSDGHIKMVLYY